MEQNIYTDITDAEKAYIAGFIDGEGTITIIKNKRSYRDFYVSVTIANTKLKPLEFIAERYGGYIREVKHKVNRKRTWFWQVTRKNSTKILQEISPYLIIKKKNAELALEYLQRIKSFQKVNQFTSFIKRQVPKEEIDFREEMRTKIRLLNN